ncbi:MAG: hypothetical protein F6K40_27595 [Okeania sp. SIO3I5]|nr:hypothetical protein [Okeania sp. SIO3I5]NEQ39810.1 hypothetical protein [Okeania sp. SIO3I5]
MEILSSSNCGSCRDIQDKIRIENLKILYFNSQFLILNEDLAKQHSKNQ